MKLNRRDVLQMAGVMAGAAVASPLLATDNNPFCGNWCHSSCAQLGMTGIYPNCYFPQYMNFNQTLCNTARYWVGQVYSKASIHQLDSNTLATAKYYTSQYLTHLKGTGIAEGFRRQWIGSVLPPKISLSPAEQAYIENTAYSAGFNGVEWANAAAATLPAARTGDQNFIQAVNALPISPGALDNINSFQMQYINSIETVNGSLCGLSAWQITEMQNFSGDFLTVGAILSTFAAATGPAAPFVEGAAGGAVFMGGIVWLWLKFCVT